MTNFVSTNKLHNITVDVLDYKHFIDNSIKTIDKINNKLVNASLSKKNISEEDVLGILADLSEEFTRLSRYSENYAKIMRIHADFIVGNPKKESPNLMKGCSVKKTITARKSVTKKRK